MYKPSEYYFVLAYIVGVLNLFGVLGKSGRNNFRHLLATGMLLSFKQNKQLKSIIF